MAHLRQVAQRATDLDRSIEFYRDVLNAEFTARFDPPGIALLRWGDVRLLLEPAAPPALLYVGVSDIHRTHDDLVARGVAFDAAPQVLHRDDTGRFGSAGEEEWAAFLRDPDGNLVAITERRLPEPPG